MDSSRYRTFSNNQVFFVCLFVCINALRPSQQQWSCQDVASILWDFGCHDTQNVLHKYNHPTKPIRLICMDGLTKQWFETTFPGQAQT